MALCDRHRQNASAEPYGIAAPMRFFFVFVFVSRNFAGAAAFRCIRFRGIGWRILLARLRCVRAPRSCNRASAAGAVVFASRFRSIGCARLHLFTSLRQHGSGFLGGNWTIDQKIEPVVAHFRRRGFVIDDSDGHCVSVGRGFARAFQQEARLRLVGPIRNHARKEPCLPSFDGREDVRTNFRANPRTFAGRRHGSARLGAL